MKNEMHDQAMEDLPAGRPTKKVSLLPASIVIAAIVLAGAWVYTAERKAPNRQNANPSVASKSAQTSELEEKVLPSEGVVLPVTWGDLGTQLVSAGAIDADKFKTVYEQRGSFTEEYQNLLFGQNDGQLKITKSNASYLLNLLWVLGLASKNPILDSGEMQDPQYGGAGNFASTGGWTLARGDAMDHYSRHEFFRLTSEQQALVDKVSRGIYRPCCGNSTHFPDCNHGMAMLGLLELMASQGVAEEDMWEAALAVNSYWFPDTYLTLAQYFQKRDVAWEAVRPQDVLGVSYSSAAGYQKILAEVEPVQPRGGGSCGV